MVEALKALLGQLVGHKDVMQWRHDPEVKKRLMGLQGLRTVGVKLPKTY
jgi:hypothetical protein